MAASVLFVDDDRNLCQIVARALRGEGYEVQTAFDGESALAQIQEDLPDLLLLDVLLPRKDGFQVLEQIRALGPPFNALPVVLLTSCTPTPAYTNHAIALDALELVSKPVPLERLLELVVSHVGEAKPAKPGQASKGEPASKRASISGQLDRIPFPAVLHHLHGLRATGVLHLECEKKRKWIQLRDGYPVAVRSNLVRETLGAFLERTGRITSDVLATSRREMERQARRQGEVLVAMRVLSEEQVAEALREQADEKLFELFSWESGRFQFERDAQLEKANVLGVGRSPANLILEGVRSRFPIERIDRYLRSQALRTVRHGSSPFYRFQELHMDPNEDALLRGLDGTTPLSGFLREEEGVRRTVYALLAAGLLELQGGPPEVEAPKAAPAAPARPPVAAARVAPPAPPKPAPAAKLPPAEPVMPLPQPAAAPKPPPPAAKPAPAAAKPSPARPAPAPAKPAFVAKPAAVAKPAPAAARPAPAKPAPAKPLQANVPLPPRRAAPSAAAGVDDQYPELAKLAEKLRGDNFFDLLGVTEAATSDQVRRAAETLLARVHPDRFKGASLTVKQLAEQVFSRINEAQQELSDPRRRQEHLLGRKRAEREANQSKKAERALEAERAFRDGDVALKARDYEGALRWFGKALQLYPDEGDHHCHYGYVLYLCHPSDPGMVGEAMEHVKRGLKTASHRDKAFLFMGRLHKALGQNEVAERMFTRAVQIQPDCVEAMRELRLINMRREKSKGIITRLLKR
jgi:CheY-like chemotaxis protein/tetratricopeptide (TPR) repeat protein